MSELLKFWEWNWWKFWNWDWWIALDGWTFLGTGCLGLTIGWLIAEFIRRAPSLGIKAVCTLAAILSGSTALSVWQVSQKTGLPREANAYFIGVFLAVVFLGALRYEPKD
ncbi:hypothetical protein IVB27_23615 [Bradyrhizobium sp. 197]|jgi:hypothetical protein|uniref:hypothetical protein n=1 Tax=Bradyrhizobium sp. 197 TaxID=2782663 RepID=UPI001FF8A9CF|nr:hypothetical protein [Bradyrhizobium sp. 197]MCK1477711.1 hypothetical protein [Bradyrhizobium sp. 197]